MRCLRLITVLCVVIFCCQGAEPPVYNVCGVLDHLQDFSCRLIRLRARLASDVDVWLTADDCTKHVEVGGVRFHDLIALKWPTSLLVGCKIPFAEDQGSHQKIRQALRTYDSRTSQIYVVVDGVIETRNPPYGLVSKVGSRMGFGHLGMVPAQIIVKDVIRLEKRSK